MEVPTVPDETTQPKLHARGLSKRYDQVQALRPIDLKVRPGELLTLLGPSGSGKTTLLQLIAGLVEPTDGQLLIDGEDLTRAPAAKRDIGVVFQSYSLFPHLTVFENVAFPLQMRKRPGAEIRTKVLDTLEMVGLTGFDQRFPAELSGGQQQRVALARCLVYQPSLILMDESLSALDRKLREAMQIEIKRLHRETGSTIIFVTHDQDEALALSDRICLMRDGGIEQIGEPTEVYDRPRTEFVADFIGISNILHGRLSDGRIVTPDGALPDPGGHDVAPGAEAAIVVRPEYLTLGPEGALLTGTVTEQIFAGSETRVLVELASGAVMTVRRPIGATPVALGERVGLSWAAENARLLSR
ncbi:MAG: polyamine ABC transporter ATP-binding protein [Rhodobacteraceae bacterium]|nr:polyamine ABC transporter ATP-binding protein [Paracoccaceae bacterium]MAY43957.1 polyamine ABC transporter ATP-binding protein [Paracoccaceae bacterium]QEW18150.1 Spermidine/putrescine import ATP-binding protein PotA [Marinibacterium anthonyi]